MRIAVAREVDPAEPRVAATPDTVKKLTALGAEVAVEAVAGVKSGVLDTDYTAAGATVSARTRDPGSVTITVVPHPFVLLTWSDPPCSSASRRASGNPRPVPSWLRA